MIIRDNVYGDIEVPAKFVELINTREFQRLRRIKQLATAEQVFPGATHSRFAHSIGVFHVMSKIVKHFEKILKSIGQERYVNEEEINIILAAALLHDITMVLFPMHLKRQLFRLNHILMKNGQKRLFWMMKQR